MRSLIVALLAVIAASSALACEFDGATWTPLSLSDRPPAQFTCAGTMVLVAADAAVGFLHRRLEPAERAATCVAWRWRVDAAPLPTDLAHRGADDRPLAVHIVFPQKSLFSNPLRWAASRLRGLVAGPPLSGRVLTFVWGGTDPPGTVISNPYLSGDGFLVIRQGSATPLGTWRSEIVDVRAEFRRVFGADAPEPIYIAISADTDDRGGLARAAVADIRFLGDAACRAAS